MFIKIISYTKKFCYYFLIFVKFELESFFVHVHQSLFFKYFVLIDSMFKNLLDEFLKPNYYFLKFL
jgi:hypothetical protein